MRYWLLFLTVLACPAVCGAAVFDDASSSPPSEVGDSGEQAGGEALFEIFVDALDGKTKRRPLPPRPKTEPMVADGELGRVQEAIRKNKLDWLMNVALQYDAKLRLLADSYATNRMEPEAALVRHEREKLEADLLKLKKGEVVLTSSPHAEETPARLDELWRQYERHRATGLLRADEQYHELLKQFEAHFKRVGDKKNLQTVNSELLRASEEIKILRDVKNGEAVKLPVEVLGKEAADGASAEGEE